MDILRFPRRTNFIARPTKYPPVSYASEGTVGEDIRGRLIRNARRNPNYIYFTDEEVVLQVAYRAVLFCAWYSRLLYGPRRYNISKVLVWYAGGITTPCNDETANPPNFVRLQGMYNARWMREREPKS